MILKVKRTLTTSKHSYGDVGLTSIRARVCGRVAGFYKEKHLKKFSTNI